MSLKSETHVCRLNCLEIDVVNDLALEAPRRVSTVLESYISLVFWMASLSFVGSMLYFQEKKSGIVHDIQSWPIIEEDINNAHAKAGNRLPNLCMLSAGNSQHRTIDGSLVRMDARQGILV